MNTSEIDTVTYDSDGSVTDLTLVAGASAYVFEQFRTSLTAQYTFVPQTVSVGYDHQITCNVWNVSQIQKNNLERMALGKITAIVENVDQNGDSSFEVYGLNVGMEVQTMARIANDLETAGSFAIDLKTSDNTGKEAKMPLSYFDTDYATTKAKIDAIVSGANLAVVSATVETASPSDIVVTFDKNIINFSGIEFGGTQTGTISNVGVAGAVVTITTSATFVNGDTITLDGVFEAADGVIALNDYSVTNNVV
jgi:hypothetical protein